MSERVRRFGGALGCHDSFGERRSVEASRKASLTSWGGERRFKCERVLVSGEARGYRRGHRGRGLPVRRFRREGHCERKPNELCTCEKE